MSYTYGFFDAVDLGSDNYDRVYSSAEFSHYWALLVGDGVFGQPSTSLNVLAMEPVAMRVKVAPGTGWIKGHYLTVPDNMDEVIAIPVANPSLPRIDSIIMALNNPDRDMKLYVRSGTAAASPQAVTLQRDADVWELELAQITVAAGAGNITQQSIKDMRTDPNRCGIVTGLIDQFDVSGFFTAAQASFNEWFENVQGQLDGDVAGNLQNQINKNAAGIATINATILKADTKTALGLPASAGPDDAFKVLANIGNVHVWKRVQDGVTDYLTSPDRNAYPDQSAEGGQDAYYTLLDVVSGATIATLATINTVSFTVKKSDSVIVSEDGIVSLPSTATENEVRINSDSDKDSIFADYKGCFVQLVGNSNVTANIKDVIWIPSDAVFSGLKPITVSKYQPVIGHAAIPASTTITYLGQLGGGARIEVGSYVGTGTYGSGNPNSLTFGFEPQLVAIFAPAKNGNYAYKLFMLRNVLGASVLDSDGNNNGVIVTWSEKSVTWYVYESKAATYQMNGSNYTYHYIAIS